MEPTVKVKHNCPILCNSQDNDRLKLARGIAEKNSATRLDISWIAEEIPAKKTAVMRPFGGMTPTEALTLMKNHSAK